MKTNKFFLLGISILTVLSGCNSKKVETAMSQPSSSTPLIVGAPFQANTTTASNSEAIKQTPIERAHKEYLDCYNEYVRLLRESGPQTMETLQALASYQRSYQIYQMMLRAGGEK